jgi:hypothetical protein
MEEEELFEILRLLKEFKTEMRKSDDYPEESYIEEDSFLEELLKAEERDLRRAEILEEFRNHRTRF